MAEQEHDVLIQQLNSLVLNEEILAPPPPFMPPITEDEIGNAISFYAPITMLKLVHLFRNRLNNHDDTTAFVTKLKRISEIQKNVPLAEAYVLLKSADQITEDEIRKSVIACSPITTNDLIAIFSNRLRRQDDKAEFANNLKRICKIQKTAAGATYLVLRDN